MDDPILARARLLINIANGGGAQDTLESQTKKKAAPTSAGEVTSAALPSGSFQVAAIRGSRLLSTQADLRNYVKRGGQVTVDGTPYTLSTKQGCEWAANRLELSSDYEGHTNLTATLAIANFAFAKSSKGKAVNTAEPIATSDIRAALTALDQFNPSVINSRRPSELKTAVVKRVGPSAPSKQPVSIPHRAYEAANKDIQGSYLQQLEFQNRQYDDHLQSERERALLRVRQKQKEDASAEAKKKKEEDERKARLHATMEAKARSLHEKTQQRVAVLQSSKNQEEQKRKEEMTEKMKKKMESDLLSQSEDHKSRMLQLKMATKKRLLFLKQEEERRRQDEAIQISKKLSQISDLRRKPAHDHGIMKQAAKNRRPTSEGSAAAAHRREVELLSEQIEEGGYTREYEALSGRVLSSPRVSRSAGVVVVSPSHMKSEFIASPFPNDDVDDDDDDGFWSNDSLDENDVVADRHQQFGSTTDALVRIGAFVGRSMDYDDVSAVTLNSPQRRTNQSAETTKRSSKPRMKLTPIPVRPYVPVPK